MDEVVNYCKTAVREMEVLTVVPDQHLHGMALILQEGIAAGFGALGDANTALGHTMTATADREGLSGSAGRPLPGRRLPRHVQAA
jgi:hypothetical protein